MKDFAIPKSYEEAMSRLQSMVAKLEAGDVAIEDLEAMMIESKQLVNYCDKRLKGIGEKLDQPE